MHVVLVVPGGVDRDGVERVIPALLWLIEGLAERHRVTVVALGQERHAATYGLLGATVHNVAAVAPGRRSLARQLAGAVQAIGAEARPDVVHGLWASVSGLAAVLGARRHRVPAVVHVAGGELVALPELPYGGALGRGGRIIAHGALRGADAVTVASEWMARHVRARGHRVDHVIPLGVDTVRFQPAPPRPTAGAATVPAAVPAGAVPAGTVPYRLVSVADLNPVKDHATLLEAVALAQQRVGPIALDLIGTDTLDGAVQRLARDLQLDARHHGFVASAALPPLLRSADLHVMSARHDAGPVAFLEAAACGVATVGTEVGHLADLAAARPPGAVVVPPAQPPALADAIVALLTDPDRRRAVAEVARSFALRHDRHATVAAFEDVYDRVRAKP